MIKHKETEMNPEDFSFYYKNETSVLFRYESSIPVGGIKNRYTIFFGRTFDAINRNNRKCNKAKRL